MPTPIEIRLLEEQDYRNLQARINADPVWGYGTPPPGLPTAEDMAAATRLFDGTGPTYASIDRLWNETLLIGDYKLAGLPGKLLKPKTLRTCWQALIEDDL